MKLLWISRYADTLDLAMRLAKEGNEVELCILSPNEKAIGDNMITKVTDWRSALSRDKVIVFDMVGCGKIASSLAKQGYWVFGGGEIQDQLELDRAFGSNAMKVAGIHTPATMTFTSFDDAIALVKKTNQKYVFKPSGNMHAALTYVAYNAEDMIQFLEQQKKVIFKEIEFEMQSVQSGIEASVEGLFDGNDWVDGWFNITWERKRKANGDLGQNTGCAHDVVKVLRDQRETPIVKKTLEKITPLLKQAKYKGLIDINCIYFNGTPFGLEWTCRFGINAIFTLSELLKTGLGETIAKVAMGDGSHRVSMRQDLYSASVRAFVAQKPKVPHRLIQNIQDFEHIHPMDVMIDSEGQLVTADVDGNIAVITASAPTIEGAASKVYSLLKKTENFGILDLEYRTDCGPHAEKMESTLQRWQLI